MNDLITQAKEEFDENFGGGDESGDFPSSAIYAFMEQKFHTLLKAAREATTVEEDRVRVMTATPNDDPMNYYRKGFLEARAETLRKWEAFMK